MKKLLVCLLCLMLLSACGGRSDDDVPVPPADPDTLTLRVVVSGEEAGDLLLADAAETGTGVYTLSPTSLPDALCAGQLVRVRYASIAETYPAQLQGVSAVEVVEGGFDDRCALYLQVLEDLWNTDTGLNGGVEVMGVDLSQTSLNPAERSAVVWAFAGKHGAEAVEGTFDELLADGYLTATPMDASGSGAEQGSPDHCFYEWENGCFFSIAEQPMEGSYSLTPVTFDAQKWRSSLGAYFFCDCTAVQSAPGEWSGYSVGAEAIS